MIEIMGYLINYIMYIWMYTSFLKAHGGPVKHDDLVSFTHTKVWHVLRPHMRRICPERTLWLADPLEGLPVRFIKSSESTRLICLAAELHAERLNDDARRHVHGQADHT